MFLTLNFLTDWINNSFHHILLFLDSVVYWAASNCYQLFIKLASTRIFEDEFFANFAQRIYSILGIFMLFYLAYALLNAIVDPEKLAKGDKSVSKLASNLIISLVILGFLPSIFTYAYRVQNYVLSSNVIGALILGTPVVEVNEGNSNEEAMLRFGDVLSFAVLNTFLNSDNTNFNIGKTIDNRDYNWFDLKADILENGDYSQMPGMAEAVSNGAIVINANGSEGNKKVIDYKGFISTIVGLFLLYIMLSFTIDLGIRIFKFAFCQLIAPIPIILRAVPGKKGTFDKYLKQTLAIYFEVFVRVACVYMAIYFIDAIYKSNNLKQFFTGGIQGMLAFVIVIMGILAGAKQLPKMISDFLGIETGGLKLGLTDKLKAGGFFAGGAMLGAGVTGLVRNGVAGARNAWKNGKDSVSNFGSGNVKSGFKSLGKALWSGTAGVVGGGISGITGGAFNSFKAGKDAKGWGDMVKAAAAGAQKVDERRLYRASNGGVIGALGADIMKAADSAAAWAGFKNSPAELQYLQNILAESKKTSDGRKAVWDRASFIRDTLWGRNQNIQAVTWTDANGQKITTRNVHLGTLTERVKQIQQTGKDENGNVVDARTRYNMEQMLKGAEKQANMDIIHGYDKDGVSVNANYDKNLQATLTGLITTLNATSSVLESNVTVNKATLKDALDFAKNNKNVDIASLLKDAADNNRDISSVGVDFSKLVDNITKPMYEANDNISIKLNQIYEESKKNKK